ncbi:MAG: pyridoxamine 5'-phosphate oxidase family protein [Actinobacteria bacterium]|nr:pyridoxamine 5'-phosphate oxidase family protein [Actinomycetota bacterium]
MPLTPEELDVFLAQPRLCHFATLDADRAPRVRPLWYLWRDGTFWFTTRLESRHTGRDVVRGPSVAISIASEDRPYRAVLAHGRIEVTGKDEALLLAISTRYGEEQGRAWTRSAMKQDDRTVLRMVPERLLSWDYGRGDSERQERGESMRS